MWAGDWPKVVSAIKAMLNILKRAKIIFTTLFKFKFREI
jgi:hypothetical protein